MTSRRSRVAAVVIMMAGVACTNPEVVEDPLAAPDVFEPTPTIDQSLGPSTTTTTRPAPTTTIDVELNALYRADPLTLEPLHGIDPIPMGDWVWGSVSDNRRWFAGRAEDDDGGLAEVRLVDLATWEVAASWQPVGYGEVHVADDGVVYYLQGGPSWPTLKRLVPGNEKDEVAAQLPEGFSPWSPIHQDGELIAAYGTTGDWDSSSQTLELVTVDVSKGVVTVIDLPQVTFGVLEEVDIGQDWFPFVSAYPAVVWDGARALVVHADQDVVTEVDLETGAVSDHPFGPEMARPGGLFAWLAAPAHAGGMPTADSTRSAVLSLDGGLLYIATRAGDAVVEDEDNWFLRTDSIGLEVIDTSTWEKVDRLDAPIGEVRISPDGTRLLAWGYTQRDSISSSSIDSHGIFVIDTADLEVLGQHEGVDDWYSNVSFSADSVFGYVSTWSATDVIDLESGLMVGDGRDGELQIWGEAGIVAGRSP